jgi:5-methylcytosine-specific restriction endonuclease McrBC regulatory subunit McrC
MDIEKIKEKREGLMTNYNTLIDKRVELEKQLEVTSNEILTMRGAILLCNELVEDQKVEDTTPIINDLDKKEEDGGQKNK